ncbi:RIP metalloprotease RseP [Suicoccus acidiformans]|nr:RIP metalloprotease RseP [Suicoccus acidiformans]
MKTIITFLFVFSAIVVFHEFGHYYFARKAGILVREFSLGMGPKLFGHQGKDGTTYTVRMLPLGGYVRLAGLNEEDELEPGMEVTLFIDENDQVYLIDLTEDGDYEALPVRVDYADLAEEMIIEGFPMGSDTLTRYSVSKTAQIKEQDGTLVPVAPIESRYESASVSRKMMTNFAGPMNNFILSVLVFMLVGFLLPGIPTNENVVGELIEDMPAIEAGLQTGDRILAVDGVEVSNWQELSTEIARHPGEAVNFQVERDGQAFDQSVQVDSVSHEQTGEVSGAIGIVRPQRTGFFDRVKYGFTETWAIMTGVVSALYHLIFRDFNLNMLGGPVAMAQMTGEVVDYGFIAILQLMAYLSANLGIVNLFPLPALDGGKLVSNVIEGIRGKPVSQEVEGIITIVGVAILVLLMLAVTWNDITRLF